MATGSPCTCRCRRYVINSDRQAAKKVRNSEAGRTLAALAEQPHPDQAVAWGGSRIYRLRLPGIRILYEVDEDAATVYVINVAVTV